MRSVLFLFVYYCWKYALPNQISREKIVCFELGSVPNILYVDFAIHCEREKKNQNIDLIKKVLVDIWS